VIFEQQAILVKDGNPIAEATTSLAFVDETGNPIPCPVREQLESI
jgi:acyl-CoA thioesterase FadM